jgi:pimeloyl-ACP methyl ester carboxylesterase
MKDSFARAKDGVNIHYLESGDSNPSLAPLVFVPGMMGIAEHLAEEMEGLQPRRTIALTHRGLGKNQKIQPGSGSFAHRCSDIEAVVKHLDLPKYFLYGFSRGVPMAVAHALEHPMRVAGLILHDCEPSYLKVSEKWRDMLIAANRPHIPAETVTAYWQDSEAIDLNPRLPEIRCPTLIFRGEKEGSLLPLEQATKMQKALGSAEIVNLPNSAHELATGDRDIFLNAIRRFIS